MLPWPKKAIENFTYIKGVSSVLQAICTMFWIFWNKFNDICGKAMGEHNVEVELSVEKLQRQCTNIIKKSSEGMRLCMHTCVQSWEMA